jgi:hypothetical protein
MVGRSQRGFGSQGIPARLRRTVESPTVVRRTSRTSRTTRLADSRAMKAVLESAGRAHAAQRN